MPDAAVVIAQRSDSAAGQRIRDDSERFVAQDLLVPVLGAAARNEHDHGDILVALRNGERSGQCVVDATEYNIFRLIGEGRLRGLRPVTDDVSAMERQRELLADL